uniref:Extended synaptotagmin-3 n=1 Tax=Auxenochlorella protothecoides TaxID=3075 RepID=A0A1D1ZVZ1_AUXPR
MVLATLIGAPLGAVAGLAIGGLITSRFIGITPDSSLTRLDVSADDQDNFDVVETEGKPVGGKEVALLGDLSRWLEDPDHRRVQFITSILGLLWPTLSSAVYKEVLVQAKQPLEDACKMTNGLVASLAITKLDLGTIPPRLDSFKTMHSESDELILEAPLFWGSDLKAAVSAVLKVGKFGLIEVPVEIANVQIKALARITIKPLVETLPCFGGITLSLMEAPHVDLDVHLAGSADLLALPLVPEAVKLAIKIFAGQMLVYPNEISVPIMENFGVPPPPQGMLHVTVVNGKNLKSSWFDKVDPFVKVEVREGKGLQTTTIDNNSHPEWNETMLFVVDDPLKQSVKICVMDEDVMSSDVVGVAEVPLKGAEFMLQAGRSVRATIPIREPPPQDDAVMHPEAAPDAHEVARDLKGENATDAQAAGAVVEVGPSSETSTPRESGDTGASGGGTPEKKEKKISKLLRKLKLKKGPSHHEEDTASSNVTTHAKHSPASKKKEGHRKKHGKDAQGEVTGHLTLEFKFTPFRGAATVTDGLEEPKRVAPRQVSRSTTKRPRAEDRGLLSLDLKRCIALEEEADTFVQLTLHDPTRGSSSDTVYKTPVVLEEQNPQYRFKTDFVNVSAMSTLTLTVFQRPSFTASTMGKIPFVHKAKAKQMGYVQIKARNVVDEERISGKWALQEAQTGEMDLAISWHAIDVEDFGDL